ncbi:hypothetical protein PNOK_0121800 [Pyrrhoderma noxium]|uniref:Uncharacterized protein n=1 Tax=Pyrrhoderma noxium TaxID=2282107 RepID=A0A286UX36_9AGAM|nr:hypothetical protein PNOK_0121800 [Pyrrhoderma noxium]
MDTEKLQELLQECSKGINDPSMNMQFLLHVNDDIIPNIDTSSCPPLSVLVYLARQLSEPDIFLDRIPTLIEIIANIEAIRRRITEKAQGVLRIHNRSAEMKLKGDGNKSDSHKITLLSKDERQKINRILKKKVLDSMRLIYREELVFSLCRLYLLHLWTSQSVSAIGIFIRKYFPSTSVKSGDPLDDEYWRTITTTDTDKDKKNSTMVLHNISYDERVKFHEEGIYLQDFLQRARTWDEERLEYYSGLGLSEEQIFGEDEDLSYSTDFWKQFGDEASEERIKDLLAAYLKVASENSDALMEIVST